MVVASSIALGPLHRRPGWPARGWALISGMLVSRRFERARTFLEILLKFGRVVADEDPSVAFLSLGTSQTSRRSSVLARVIVMRSPKSGGSTTHKSCVCCLPNDRLHRRTWRVRCGSTSADPLAASKATVSISGAGSSRLPVDGALTVIAGDDDMTSTASMPATPRSLHSAPMARSRRTNHSSGHSPSCVSSPRRPPRQSCCGWSSTCRWHRWRR